MIIQKMKKWPINRIVGVRSGLPHSTTGKELAMYKNLYFDLMETMKKVFK
jgi:hypothetical protein